MLRYTLLLILCISPITLGAEVIFPDDAQTTTLEAGGKKHTVSYIKALGRHKGAIILVQNTPFLNYHKEVIDFLLKTLPEKGYSTLGLCIPNTKEKVDCNLKDLLPAAVSLLRKEQRKAPFILLYGQGAGTLMSHISENPIKGARALLLLSAFDTDKKSYAGLIKNIKKWRLPMYDIKAQFDLTQVERDFKLRNQIFTQNPYYRKHIIRGAANDYIEALNVVIRFLQGFIATIDKHFRQIRDNKPLEKAGVFTG